MDWPKLLQALRGRGLTQAEIAARCHVAQSTISDLASGRTKSPGFALGQALLKLQAADEAPAPGTSPVLDEARGAA